MEEMNFQSLTNWRNKNKIPTSFSPKQFCCFSYRKKLSQMLLNEVTGRLSEKWGLWWNKSYFNQFIAKNGMEFLGQKAYSSYQTISVHLRTLHNLCNLSGLNNYRADFIYL